MKNKIKNTEMEYIAKAKCGGDSSFPTHSFRRSYFSDASMITVLCKSLYVFPNSQHCSQVSEDFYEHTKEVITSAGSVYLYIYIKIN